MGVEIEGEAEVVRMLNAWRSNIQYNLPFVLQESANKITIRAKQHHRYTTRTGNAERETRNEVDTAALAFRVYLGDDLTTTKGGYNYPELIHNGTKYIKADPFLKEANELYEESIVKEIEEEIWRSLTQAL